MTDETFCTSKLINSGHVTPQGARYDNRREVMAPDKKQITVVNFSTVEHLYLVYAAQTTR